MRRPFGFRPVLSTINVRLKTVRLSVTEAAIGIGFATAQRLASEGSTVVIADIDEEKLNLRPIRSIKASDIGKPRRYRVPRVGGREIRSGCCSSRGRRTTQPPLSGLRRSIRRSC